MGVFARMGWEFNSGVEWYDTATGTAPVTQSSTVRSGGFALRCDGTAANASWLHNGGTSAVGLALAVTTKYFYRIFFQVSALPTTTTRIMSFRQAVATDTGCTIRLTTAGKLQVGTVAAGVFTQVGSDSAATLSTNTWCMAELARSYGVGAIDYIEGRMDGVSIASTTTGNVTDTGTGILTLGWESAPGNTTSLFIDDMALNDDTGVTTQTSWPGSGTVVLLRPISDNARVGWTDGAGGTTALFDAVDNQPPVGVGAATATSQIKDAVSNTTDHYDANLATYTTAGIAAADTINAVYLIINHARTTNAGLVHGVKLVSNPVISEFTTGPPANTAGTYPANWKWGGGGGTATPSVTLGTSPVMSVRKSATGSPGANNSYFDAMGLYVDYVPGTPTIPDVTTAMSR